MNLTIHERFGRTCVDTGAMWEPVVGYSRAVRTGPLVSVTGTIGLSPDGSLPPTAGGQAARALEIVLAALRALGAGPEHVARTRIYVTDIDEWREVGAAHAAVFGEIRPATTMVEVSRLAMDGALVEIEADAYLNG
ncbi:MAG: RidA family protein [Planctomycetota bacterium]|nr:RidA family protein [Planctomycetota bacterium]